MIISNIRAAHEDTSEKLITSVNLLEALYDLAVESRCLGNSDRESQSIMTLIVVAREKARATEVAHDAEWRQITAQAREAQA